MAASIGRDEAVQLMESLSRPAAKSVRCNRRLCPEEELKGEIVPWNAPFGRYWTQQTLPSRTLEYAAGMYYIQEAGAMLAIAAAEQVVDFAGKIVLDLTAAPGGKATQAAELLTGGYIVANEVVKKRTAALTWNINRLRLDNVIVTSLPTALLARSLPGFFDIVIVDAPCSGEGLFQRGKHSLSKWSEKNVRFCARRQESILRDALELLRPGGYLVYSTCTFAVEENENQVEFLLERGLRPVPLPARLPVSPAVTGNKKVAACARRIFPHREGGAGAFVAVLQKEPRSRDLPTEMALDYAFHNTREITAKAGFPSILTGNANKQDLTPGSSGYFFEKSGVVSFFSYERVPVFLFQHSLQLGAPFFDRRRGNELMFGAVRAAAGEAVIEVSEQDAESYIRGEEIVLDLTAGKYFVSYRGMVLGPISAVGKGTVNKFPKALQR